MNINQDKLRNIVKVIEEGILVKFDGTKSYTEDKSQKKKS